jgi:site-specific DNA-methyltransferase (adenine-specific)
MPMRNVEDICVFFKQRGNYNPQGLKPFEKTFRNSKPKSEYVEERGKATHNGGRLAPTHTQHFTNYPTQILTFKRERTTHPTQKPVALFEYLIRTYTNEGDTVLDNCSGSGTTAIACLNSNRNFICMEMNPTIHAQSVQRLNTHTPKML